jgi:anti-anti-sigma factor
LNADSETVRHSASPNGLLTSDTLTDPSLSGDVVLDIGLLTFLDSSGLALFLTVHKKLDAVGRKLVIFSPTRTARRLFQITELTEFLSIEPPERTQGRPRDLDGVGG